MKILRTKSLVSIAAFAVASVCSAGCADPSSPSNEEAPAEEAPAKEQALVGDDANLQLEEAVRAIDRSTDVPAARAKLEALLAGDVLSAEKIDEAKLARSRALEIEGDKEGAIKAVEELLASRAGGAAFPAREAATQRLRFLLTGQTESSFAHRLPSARPLPPAATALGELFTPDERDQYLVEMAIFGEATNARHPLFEVAAAKRETLGKSLNTNISVRQSVSQFSSWTDLPIVLAETNDMPRPDRSLTIFYYDLGTNKIPSRYDEYLAMPSEEIAEALEGGQGLIAIRKRAGALPIIVIAAPRTGQLHAVEEAFSKFESIEDGVTPVPLQKGLNAQEIQAVVRGSFGRQRSCYEELLTRDPQARGEVSLEFWIDEEGKVGTVNVGSNSSLTDPTLHTCMKEAMTKVVFPASGEKTRVTYPIAMSP